METEHPDYSGYSLVSIDFGTEQIRVLIAAWDCKGLHLLGSGTASVNWNEGNGTLAKNIWKGEIKNRNQVVLALKNAMQAAEEESEIDLSRAIYCLGCSGSELLLQSDELSRKIPARDSVVSEDFLTDLIHDARQELFQKFCRNDELVAMNTWVHSYWLDGRMVMDATGMTGRMLSAKILCVQGRRTFLNSLVRILREVVDLPDPVHQILTCYLPFSLGFACSDVIARQNTSHLLIDIGAGQTSFSVISGSTFPCLEQIPVGCYQIENDLAQAFRIEIGCARRLMRRLGELQFSLNHEPDGRNRLATVPRSGKEGDLRYLPLSSIEQVVGMRLEELFALIGARLNREKQLFSPGCPVWLSGGGAMIPGIREFASRLLGCPVEILSLSMDGKLENAERILKQDPRHAVGVGLLRYALQSIDVQRQQEEVRPRTRGWKRLKEWFRRTFHEVFVFGEED